MDKTYQAEIRRSFLIEGLPEQLTPASAHLQIFDNYLKDTRLRLRSIRSPEEKSWSRHLQQRFPSKPDDWSIWKFSELVLNEAEYSLFKDFEGREVRKNRYFHEFHGKEFEFDIYLGDLQGLKILNVRFENTDEALLFKVPEISVFEISKLEFFTGEILVEKEFADVQEEFTRIRENLK